VAVIWDPFGRQLALGEYDLSNNRDALEQAYDGDASGAAGFLQQRAAEGELFRYFGYDVAMLTHEGKLRTYHVSYSNPKTVALLAINRGIPLELDDIQGYNPIQIQRYVDYLIVMNGIDQSYHSANVLHRGATSPLLDQLDVRYIVVPRDVPPGRPDLLHLSQRYPTVYVDDTVRVIEKTDSTPRAWVVHTARTGTDDEALDLLATSALDPRVEAIVPPDVTLPTLGVPEDPSSETVTIVHHSPDELTFDVSLGAPGMVVVSEIWDPDWTVEVDGQEVELYRVNSILRGVAVPAGTHSIRMVHDSQTLFMTAVVSGIGWLIVLIGGAAYLLHWLLLQRRRTRHDEELGHDSPDVAGAAGSWPKPGPLVDAPRTQVE
jgi:hypothetical protein